MRSILVQTPSATYPVFVQRRVLENLATRLRKLGCEQQTIFVVTSPEIWSLWSKAFVRSFSIRSIKIHPLFVPAGERHKRLNTIERLAEELSAKRARRDALLIAFGGGVIGDMTGFLAAIYMRGVRYIGVPTTYLAQIDSSLGGKTGVNLRGGKNLIGCFHHPAAVFSDPTVLSTLPVRELRSGIVESVKAAVLGDARFFGWLEKNLDELLAGDAIRLQRVIEMSVKIKAAIVGEDERESGQRMLLNLGHTVGHAIEAATQYRGMLHGEAVAWGMLAATQLAIARAAMSIDDARRIEQLLLRLGPFPRVRTSAEKLLQLTAADKKHLQSASRFILPVRIGEAVVVEDVSSGELLAAIQAMQRTMRNRGV